MVNGTGDHTAVSTSVTEGDSEPFYPRTVLHIITGLNVGGAENMLAKLIEHQLPTNQTTNQEVLSLIAPGAVAERIRTQGVHIHTLGMRAGVPVLSALPKLRKIVRTMEPDLIVGWMHHGFLAAWVASRMMDRRPPVIWNVRHSLSDIRHEKRLTQIVLRSAAKVSGSAASIIYNSTIARAQYDAIGFENDQATIIPNGFDCEAYSPDSSARAWLDQEFNINPSLPVIGMVARYHPMKDPGNLVKAVAAVRSQGHDVHLLIVGKGMEAPPEDLRRLLSERLPEGRFTLEGVRFDVPKILAGIDILALPSAWGEAFPNILGEAMACATPCVATDVGDSKMIIDDTGFTVPPENPTLFAEGIVKLLTMSAEERRGLGLRARTRVQRSYAIPMIVEQYSSLYEQALRQGAYATMMSDEGRAII